jgi:speckle-type POZ protein
VCALSGGFHGQHAAFVAGAPPAEPGFETAAVPTVPAPVPPTQLEIDLAVLLDSGKGADVTFRVVTRGGSEEIVAHRLILAMRSPVLEAMLAWGGQPAAAASSSSSSSNSSGGGGGGNSIEVEDVEPAVFKQLLRWIYTGQCEEGAIEAMADHLLEAAAKFGLPSLQALASRTMVTALDAEKLCDYFALAHAHDDKELKSACAALMTDTAAAAAVMKTDGWKRLKKERPLLGAELWECSTSEATAGGGKGQKRKRL